MIAFIVLHYKNYNDTSICVDSILKNCQDGKYQIIVVDNASNNGSKEYFENTYGNNKNIHFIYNQENLGFSKGNNIGCKFAIDNFAPDFLYVINNDTKIVGSNVIEVIDEVFQKTGFDVLGPNIYDVTKKRKLNPVNRAANYDEALVDYEMYKKHKKSLALGGFVYHYYSIAYYIIHKKKLKKTAFGLCGAALIFSKKYFDRFADVFPELSYMYMEESYLTYRAIKHNLKIVYDESLYIEHFGSKATVSLFKSKKNLYRFKIEEMLKAQKILVELFEYNLDI